MIQWKLVNDPSDNPKLTLCHYEAVEVPDPKPRCCEFWDQEMECLECVKEGGPEAGGQVRWHSAFYCPFCRGKGVPVNR